MRKDGKRVEVPSLEQIEAEVKRMHYRSRYNAMLRSTVYTLVVVAAVAILVATLWLPFLRIYGTSMTPTLTDGELICCLKTSSFKPGDIIAFYFDNKILVKRVVGQAGDWIDIQEDGTVCVNGQPLDEPYLTDKARGTCDIEFPYQVPESRVFVLGDHRSTSVDSRNTAVGCVAQEQIVGKILVRIWPLSRIGIVE